MKIRKQIRLGDIYKYICTNIAEMIRGIKDYHCELDFIVIWYDDDLSPCTYYANNDKQRKYVIKEINKRIRRLYENSTRKVQDKI